MLRIKIKKHMINLTKGIVIFLMRLFWIEPEFVMRRLSPPMPKDFPMTHDVYKALCSLEYGAALHFLMLRDNDKMPGLFKRIRDRFVMGRRYAYGSRTYKPLI